MGKYYIFDVPGNNVNIQIIDATKHINIKKIIIYVICGLVAVAIVVFVILFAKKHSKKRERKNTIK